jgi:hypothetical protein
MNMHPLGGLANRDQRPNAGVDVADGDSLTALGLASGSEADRDIGFVCGAGPLDAPLLAPTLQRRRASGDLPAGERVHVAPTAPGAARPAAASVSGLALGALSWVER